VEAPAQPQLAELQEQLSLKEKALAEAQAELSKLKSSPAPEQPASADLKQLTDERDALKKQLEDVRKDLANVESHASAAAPGSDAAKLAEVEKERDSLRQQVSALAAAPAQQPPPAAPVTASADLEQLRAKLKVLEAASVPFTAEELAVMKNPSSPMNIPPAVTNAPSSKAHSYKDLSATARAAMQDASVDVMAGRYDDAEKKFLEILAQDENNIYVLCNLGSAELGAKRLDDCDKTVRHALDLDPNDPGSLYLLGILRYRQEKLDDALAALSRSAALNTTNASTQNYLGCVLADKGLRTQAETALRKAVDLDPGYADAHFNLALVYAAETPPSPALARLHYQKALDLGHPKSDSLEKMLSDAK
jgi:tetratricopeptide (TPR) repeat protein